MFHSFAMAQFASASTAGIVYAMFGFVPDFVILISAHGATNPNIYLWANNDSVDDWAAALSLLLTGSTGVVTRDTSGITAYAGGDKIAANETADTAGKHVDEEGNFALAGEITRAGIAIPADHQANSGANLVLAFRRNR